MSGADPRHAATGTREPFEPPAGGALPDFAVHLVKPDLSPWRQGNVGIPGFMSFAGAAQGPHVMIVSLIHGNEIAGAIALDTLLRRGIRPLRGRLTLGFANLAAFDRFDPERPTVSRFIDEDLNRVWDEAVLDGPRVSEELVRGRQIRRLVDQADILLDLHSMLWPADPLILCGDTARGRDLARAIGTPPLVVADSGHAGGRRLLDYRAFSDSASSATACLVEAGQHWEVDTVATSIATILSLLRLHGIVEGPAADPAPEAACATVTDAITAATGRFAFVRPFRGGDVVDDAGTLIAHDGEAEIRTPYDRCLMVMPNLRSTRGHTAVRLARFV